MCGLYRFPTNLIIHPVYCDYQHDNQFDLYAYHPNSSPAYQHVPGWKHPERGMTSLRNGHLAPRPSNIEPTQLPTVREPPSVITHRYSRTRRGKKVPSLPIRLRATVVLPTTNHQECSLMALQPPCMTNSRVTRARMAVKE